MADQIKSKKGLLKAYATCSEEVQDYFEHLPSLVEDYPLHVCLAYAFSRLELGQNMALYCGVVKLHRVHTDIAGRAVNSHHMTRQGYVDLYRRVFGFDLPKQAREDLKTAEDTRDDVMHGKATSPERIRNAIARVVEYADAANDQLHSKHGLKPFGPLRGFKGRATSLEKSTSRWVVKGMGFDLS